MVVSSLRKAEVIFNKYSVINLLIIFSLCLIQLACAEQEYPKAYNDNLQVLSAKKQNINTLLQTEADQLIDNLTALYKYNEKEADFAKYAKIVLTANEYVVKLSYKNDYGSYPQVKPSLCKDVTKDIKCDEHSKKYRRTDGTCNNLEFPWAGSAFSPFKRCLKPNYQDGVQAMRTKSVEPDYYLPHPRSFINTFQYPRPTKSVWSNYLISFGQTVAHDLVHTVASNVVNYRQAGEVCNCTNSDSLGGDCISIPVGHHDREAHYRNQQCFSFLRSKASILSFNCDYGPREQLNEYTSYLDLGFIYGHGSERDPHNRALLATSLSEYGEEGFPLIHKHKSCPYHAAFENVYKTSDVNAEQNVYQTASQVVWLRFHNYLARRLLKLEPDADKDLVFEEARRINIAVWQHVVYNEYVPNTIGFHWSEKYKLIPLTWGYTHVYTNQVLGSIYNEFATAAYRCHNLVANEQCYADSHYRTHTCHNIVVNMENSTQACYSLDTVLRGQLATQSYYTTPQVSYSMNNWLLKKTESIALLNVLRGRDHGLQGYIHYRHWCGFGLAKSFHDLTDIPHDVRVQLMKHYKNVEDIDLWVGGISELPSHDSMFGKTFSCIIGRQFLDLKRTDRFYYESGSDSHTKFTSEQLNAIRGVQLAHVLCRVLKSTPSVPKWPFLYPNAATNPLVNCNNYKEIDLKYFAKYLNYHHSSKKYDS